MGKEKHEILTCANSSLCVSFASVTVSLTLFLYLIETKWLCLVAGEV